MAISTLHLVSTMQSVSETKDPIRSKYMATKAVKLIELLNKILYTDRTQITSIASFYSNETVYKLLYCTIWSLKYFVYMAFS